jgi:hypothetical protein
MSKEKCIPHGFTDCCNIVMPTLDASECLDFHLGNCAGEVEYRMPLSGTGRSFARCDLHWSERLDAQDRINRRYPDSPFAPAGFDPTYAGESWDGDY